MNREAIGRLLESGVESGVFCGGAAAAWGPRGIEVWVAGKTRADDLGEFISERTRFDLASLTKVLGLATVIARKVGRKELSLDEEIRELFPELPWHSGWSAVTVEEILTHTAGFAKWYDFSGSPQEAVFGAISSMPPEYERGSQTLYSDLGFILLGEWIRRRSGLSLEELIVREVCAPLRLSTITARPREARVPLRLIAATENISARGGIVHGEVHDGNAFLLGGIAGHAGLFGDAADCLTVGRAWCDALHGNTDFLKPAIAKKFAKRAKAALGEPRAIGWAMPSLPNSSGGTTISENAIGHLGYTGTSLWIDPARKAVVVLLTNRVHPTASNEKIREFRPLFHDAVWKEIA